MKGIKHGDFLLKEVSRVIDREKNSLSIEFKNDLFYGKNYTSEVIAKLETIQIMVQKSINPVLWSLFKDAKNDEIIEQLPFIYAEYSKKIRGIESEKEINDKLNEITIRQINLELSTETEEERKSLELKQDRLQKQIFTNYNLRTEIERKYQQFFPIFEILKGSYEVIDI